MSPFFDRYSVDHYNYRILLEKYAERAAISYVYGANFVECLRFLKWQENIVIYDEHGKSLTVRGSDVYNKATWEKFLSTQDAAHLDLCSLADNAAPLAGRYMEWLLTSYTSRYRSIKSEQDIRWLKQITALTVVRRIMEYKHEILLTQGRNVFADAYSAFAMRLIEIFKHILTEAAKSINHDIRIAIEKERIPEEFSQSAIQTIDHLAQTSYKEVRQVLADMPNEPLPPLPPGAPPSLPEALLSIPAPLQGETQLIEQEVQAL